MKSVIQVVLLGLIVVLGAIFVGESILPEPYGQQVAPMICDDLGIIGPNEVVVGELARLEAEGDIVKWDCIPHIADGQAYDNKYVCSFREPGVYNIVAAVYIGEDVQILHLPITVKGDTPVPPPAPPGPAPVLDVDPELVADVIKWCQGANRQRVKDVASVFLTVASEIEAGNLSTTGEIVNRTALLNRDIDLAGLQGLMARIQTYLTRRADLGQLTTVKEHLVVWVSIAQGLDQYAN